MSFDKWWAQQPKGDPTKPITPRMAWDAALTAANEHIEYLEGYAEACKQDCSVLIVALTAERAISDKLEKALEWVRDVNAMDYEYQRNARSTLTEIAAIRKGDENN